jgi:uncharacterized protein with HEPN domain
VRDDRVYIDHVLDCVRRIDRYCQNGEDAFRESELIQDAVLRIFKPSPNPPSGSAVI